MTVESITREVFLNQHDCWAMGSPGAWREEFSAERCARTAIGACLTAAEHGRLEDEWNPKQIRHRVCVLVAEWALEREEREQRTQARTAGAIGSARRRAERKWFKR